MLVQVRFSVLNKIMGVIRTLSAWNSLFDWSVKKTE